MLERQDPNSKQYLTLPSGASGYRHRNAAFRLPRREHRPICSVNAAFLFPEPRMLVVASSKLSRWGGARYHRPWKMESACFSTAL